MVIHNIDSVSFALKERADFSFLSRYGKAFCVFSENDSGNISFGVGSGKQKYFVKIAGADTTESCTGKQVSINTLKAALPMYAELAHPHLIHLVDSYAHNQWYVAVFQWAEGDCLFDHWNFEKYKRNGEESPRERFKKLPRQKKLDAFDLVFEFLAFTESKGYVAVDFYDGSLLYDFGRGHMTICDIDLFRKSPTRNDIGADFWGTKRLKSPEEYVLGARIDTVTNVFHLGALLLHYFGTYTDEEIQKMYRENAFFPCRYEVWELSEALYDTAAKAVLCNRADRYPSVQAFYQAWRGQLARQ